MPSSVDYFLEHVNVQTRKGRVLEPQPSPSKLPAGQASSGLHLQSRAKLTCSSCLGPTFFYGNSVLKGGVPVYAIVRDYQDAWNTIDVVYHMFYPYNRGKQVCLGEFFQPSLFAEGEQKEQVLFFFSSLCLSFIILPALDGKKARNLYCFLLKKLPINHHPSILLLLLL